MLNWIKGKDQGKGENTEKQTRGGCPQKWQRLGPYSPRYLRFYSWVLVVLVVLDFVLNGVGLSSVFVVVILVLVLDLVLVPMGLNFVLDLVLDLVYCILLPAFVGSFVGSFLLALM